MYLTEQGVDYYAYTASRSPRDDADTVVFVHGTAMDHTVWVLQSRYFAYHDRDILALDLPGHGLSGGEPLNSIEGYGDWLVAILRQVPGRRIHLVGHSMGALICLQAAAQAAALEIDIATLSLVGFAYPMHVATPLLEAARDRPSEAYAMMTQWSHASPIGGEPNPGFWSPGGQMALMENSHPGAVFTDLTACNSYAGAEAAFAAVPCPVLFISGTQDRMAPARLAKQQADANPNATIIMLPECGHNLMSENPDGVRDALRDFMACHG